MERKYRPEEIERLIDEEICRIEAANASAGRSTPSSWSGAAGRISAMLRAWLKRKHKTEK